MQDDICWKIQWGGGIALKSTGTGGKAFPIRNEWEEKSQGGKYFPVPNSKANLALDDAFTLIWRRID